VNQGGFLPHSVRFEEVNSEEVVFSNPEGIRMDVTRLSDGYRSVLSLTFELIRQMVACYGTHKVFRRGRKKNSGITVSPPGVVMIDEIDVHLHPTWQRRIGGWLTKYFPNLQFIVSTHSPLICQSAEVGSIYRLPIPGDEEDSGKFVEGVNRERLISGDVLDAYGTEMFGRGVNRSDVAQESMKELALLNQKTLGSSSESVGKEGWISAKLLR